MKIFISGPVSGPMEERGFLFVYNRFLAVENKISEIFPDAIIYNPMKMCSQRWSWLRCMIKCLWVLVQCEGVYMLPNYHESKGSRIEHKWATFFKKEIIYLTTI